MKRTSIVLTVTTLKRIATFLVLASCLKSAWGCEFEPLNRAIAESLGTTKAVRTRAQVGKQDVTVYFAKDSLGKPSRYAVVRSAVYQPNCNHTWVIGIGADGKVQQIRVVEMSCPHAHPACQNSFLDQYTGQGPASLKRLKSNVQIVAQATGTSNLTTEAVSYAVLAVDKLRRGK